MSKPRAFTGGNGGSAPRPRTQWFSNLKLNSKEHLKDLFFVSKPYPWKTPFLLEQKTAREASPPLYPPPSSSLSLTLSNYLYTPSEKMLPLRVYRTRKLKWCRIVWLIGLTYIRTMSIRSFGQTFSATEQLIVQSNENHVEGFFEHLVNYSLKF